MNDIAFYIPSEVKTRLLLVLLQYTGECQLNQIHFRILFKYYIHDK